MSENTKSRGNKNGTKTIKERRVAIIAIIRNAREKKITVTKKYILEHLKQCGITTKRRTLERDIAYISQHNADQVTNKYNYKRNVRPGCKYFKLFNSTVDDTLIENYEGCGRYMNSGELGITQGSIEEVCKKMNVFKSSLKNYNSLENNPSESEMVPSNHDFAI